MRRANLPAPGPRIAEPQRRQQMQRGNFGSAINGRDSNQDFLDPSLAILDENVEIAIFLEYSGVDQFEFRIRTRPALIFGE